MRRLAVIPARSGSKRIADKNIRPFAGKPALLHPLQAAAAAGVFDAIEVSTDDPAIAAVAASAGRPPKRFRPKALSGDHVPIRAAVADALAAREEAGEGPFETVALLYATAFFLTPEDISAAIAAFEAGPLDKPLLAVAPVGAPLERLLVKSADGILRPACFDGFAARAQDLTPVYQDAGALCVFHAETVRADAGGAPLAFRPFPLPRWKGIDIDTPEDWALAERLAPVPEAQERAHG